MLSGLETSLPVTDERRSQRLGWTLGFGGGSIWMIGPVLGAFAFGAYRLGLLSLAMLLLNLALIVYLSPWKHPNVPLWKLYFPIVAFQLVWASAVITMYEWYGGQSEGLPPMTWLAVFLPLLIFGRQRWDQSAARPKPVAASFEELA